MSDDSPTPKTYADHTLAARHRAVMTGASTRSSLYVPPGTPYAVSGRGSTVTDHMGHEALDFNNNYTALLHGHCYEPIVSAVTEQISVGSAFGLPTESEVVLAEQLSSRTDIPKWRFNNSGSEAVMTALRGARAFTGRDVIVRFTNSYHGMHDAMVDVPSPGISASWAGSVIVLPENEVDALDQLFRTRGNDIAAVIMELMPNRSGLVPVAADFVSHVRDVTSRHGALLILDEVITFRLAVGGMHTVYGVTPDLVTLGKIIGGGFPVGAVGGTDEVMSVFDPLRDDSVLLGGTFSANPVTMVAGHVALSMFGPAQVAALNQLGDNFRQQLSEAGVTVNGYGSLARLSYDGDRRQLWWRLYEAGLLIGASTLMALSTPMTQDEVDRAVGIIAKAVRQ